MLEMPPIPEFRCEVQPHRDEIVLALEGELDLATAPAVEQELRELHAAGFTSFVVDLGALTYMDSSGVELLFRWARRDDMSLRMEHVPAHVDRLLTLVGFSPG